MKQRKKRGYPRFLIDLPMAYSVIGGLPGEDRARVHDLTPEGFGFETPKPLKTGVRLAFSIEVGGGERVSGQARLVWCRHLQHSTWAGAHITKLSWRDRRRLKALVLPPGYDWEAFFDRLLTAGFVVAVVLLTEDLLRHHRGLVRVILGLWPEILAAAAVLVSTLWFLRRRR
jgi:hypothetical protein